MPPKKKASPPNAAAAAKAAADKAAAAKAAADKAAAAKAAAAKAAADKAAAAAALAAAAAAAKSVPLKPILKKGGPAATVVPAGIRPAPRNPPPKKTLTNRAFEAATTAYTQAKAATNYVTNDPYTAFYEISPWVLLVSIFLVFIVAGIVGMMGCTIDWTNLVPTFGLRDRIYVLG